MIEKIQNVVFDMGNVLIDFDPERYLRPYPREDRVRLRNEVFRSVEWLRIDRGEITPEAAAAAVQIRVPTRLHAAVADLFQNWHRDIPPTPGMEELVRRLHRDGYTLYVLSNTGKAYYEFRRSIPALECFSGEFISADCGLLKPDEAIYRRFFEQYGLSPANCVFIDDSPPNIESALRMGMRGIVFHGDIMELRRALVQQGVDAD